MQNIFFKHTIFLLTIIALISVGACGPTSDAKASADKEVHDEQGPREGDDHIDGEDDHDDDEDDHTDEGQSDSGEEEEHEDVVNLSEAELKEFNIQLSTAGPGSISTFVDLPGEIVINSDAMVHVLPWVDGVVSKVNKKLGDNVAAGEVLAVLESRELAELKVNYLSALERFNLASEIFSREEKLWKQQITAEQEFLTTKQGLAEARINLRSTEQKLYTLGFSKEHLAKKQNHPDATFTRFEVKAPFAGTVIEKHITLGESVNNENEIFVIADLSSVWVDISIYQKDLPLIKKGQNTIIDPGYGLERGKGIISYIGHIVGESTRTAPARIVLDNSSGQWRPGTFITAKIAINDQKLPLVVPRSALQTYEGSQVIFVQDEDGFEPLPVVIGLGNQDSVEVVSGITPGQVYVSEGAFTLKAQLSKAAFGDGHNH